MNCVCSKCPTTLTLSLIFNRAEKACPIYFWRSNPSNNFQITFLIIIFNFKLLFLDHLFGKLFVSVQLLILFICPISKLIHFILSFIIWVSIQLFNNFKVFNKYFKSEIILFLWKVRSPLLSNELSKLFLHILVLQIVLRFIEVIAAGCKDQC